MPKSVGEQCCMDVKVILEIELSGWLVDFPLPLRHLLCNTVVCWVEVLELCGIT